MIEPDDLVSPGRLRTMQIIAGALVLGVLIFLAVALYIVQILHEGQGLAPPGDQAILSLLALGMLALMAIVSLVLPNALIRQGLRGIAQRPLEAPPNEDGTARADVEQIVALRQTTLIVSLALIEGPAFLGCLAYLLEGRPFVLAVVGLAIGLMLVRFPTQAGLRSWVRYQLDWLERARQENAS